LGVGIETAGGVLGSSEPDRDLLDAAALWGHPVAPGSVEGFWPDVLEHGAFGDDPAAVHTGLGGEHVAWYARVPLQ
jgi:hypothetical protein